MQAIDRLQRAMDRTGSIACLGLDPRPALVPPPLVAAALAAHGDTQAGVAAAFLAFTTGLIDAAAGLIPAVKPQLACYEAYGVPGMACLEATIAHARARGLEVIADGKRNDIGSTAEHYAQAWLGAAPSLQGGTLPGPQADWLTITPYLGADTIAPCTGPAVADRGIFVLVRTSNPSAGDLQDQSVPAGTLADHVASLVDQWGRERRGACGLSSVGAVVGATYPAQARALRERMPDTPFLVPGYGAQGASARDALAGARPDGRGVLVNSSRAIMGAWQRTPGDAARWQELARAALEAMNRDLTAAR